MIKPYYDREGIQIFLGDCLEIMPTLDRKFDLILTDPPYGIDYSPKYGRRKMPNGTWLPPKEMPSVIGDKQDFDPAPFFVGGHQIFWGANHYANRLPHNGRWLVWDKRCQIIPSRNQADCEFAWCSDCGAARIFYHYWDGMVKKSEHGTTREHPTQKPIALMKWCLSFYPGAVEICDPFLGSGTTLVAAAELHRQAVGIEICEKYCEISAKRVERVLNQGELFT